MTENDDRRAQTIRDLTRQLQQVERSRGRDPRGKPARPWPTGIDPLDRLLPEGGFLPGTLTEWLTDGAGTGAVTLALLAVRRTLQEIGGALVVVDLQQEFHSRAAAQLGINLDQIILVRPATARDALWTLEQALRSAGAVISFGWIEQANNRTLRRLQLAAEVGGGLGMLIRPIAARRQPCWAQLRLVVRPLPAAESSSGRRLRIELLHNHGEQAIHVELDDETGDVHLVPPVVSAARRQRA